MINIDQTPEEIMDAMNEPITNSMHLVHSPGDEYKADFSYFDENPDDDIFITLEVPSEYQTRVAQDLSTAIGEFLNFSTVDELFDFINNEVGNV